MRTWQIEWYILRRLGRVFFLSLVAFCLMLLSQGGWKLGEIIAQVNLNSKDLFMLSLGIVGAILPLTVPIGVMVSILYVWGRMGEEGELLAISASGGDLRKIGLWTSLVFASIWTVVGLYWSNYGAPRAMELQRCACLRMVSQGKALSWEPGLFNDLGEGRTLFAEARPATGELTNVFLAYPIPEGKDQSVVVAKRGNISLDNELNLAISLHQGSLYRLNTNSYLKVRFDQLDLKAPTYNILNRIYKIFPNYKLLPTPQLKNHLTSLTDKREWLCAQFEYNRRYTYPFAALAIALLALPLALYLHTGNRSVVILVSMAGVLVYYLFLLMGKRLAEANKIAVSIGLWLPNLVIGVIGMALTLRLMRRWRL